MPETVDTSVYNPLMQPNRGPLGLVTDLTNLQATQNQNDAFAQQFAARKAMGGIIQKSIDPETGQIDYSKAITQMAMDPQTAYLAPTFASDALQRQGVQADLLAKNLGNAKIMTENYGNQASGLLATWGSPENAKQTDVIKTIADMVGTGQITRDHGISMVAALPSDGKELYNKVRQDALYAAGASKALDAVFGSIQTTDAGNRTQFSAVSPLTGQTRDLGAVQKGVSPEQANALVEGQTPAGAPTVQPRASISPMAGAGASGVVQGQNDLIGNTAEGSSLLPQDAPPPMPQAQAQPQAAAVSRPAAGPVVMGPDAATAARNTDIGKGMADYELKLNDAVAMSGQQMQSLQVAKEALKSFQTGGGGEARAKLATLAQASGMPQSTVDKIAGGDLGAAQEFEKIMVSTSMAALKQAAGTGQKFTNFEYEKFSKANPNLDTDPRAVEKILDLYTRISKINYKEQQRYAQYKQTGEPLENWPAYWQKQLVKSGVVNYDGKTKEKK